MYTEPTAEPNYKSIEITAPEHVEVAISGDGKTLWINVDGICKLRCCQIDQSISILDRRERADVPSA